MRHRAVSTGFAVLLAFALASAALVVWTTDTRAADQRLVATARDQVQRTHVLSAQAQLLADDLVQAPELTATLAIFERSHLGLRFEDAGLGLAGAGGTDLDVLYTAIEPAFTRVTAAVEAVIAQPGGPNLDVEIADAADSYRTQMSRIASVLASDAAAHSVRAQQLQLIALTVGYSLAIMVLMVAANTKQQAVAHSERLPGPGDLDQLTGLVRRHALREHLIDVIHRRPEYVGFVALLLVDIRPATDRIGGPTKRAFDRVVWEAARRLRATVRSTDLVARTGRVQFAVVIDRSPRVDDAGRVAAKLIEALSDSITVGTTEIDMVPAIGIALSPLDAATGDELLEKADLALRIASERPAAAYRYSSPELRAGLASRAELARALREAVGNGGQLWVAYQPKIRLQDSSVIGLEALARWDHPELGSVEPVEFIPIAEESHLILEFGEWTIESVCKQIASWREEGEALVPVSINVSSRQFRHGDLDDMVATALARHDISEDLIEIEITEGVLINDHERPLAHMRDLRNLGIKIAIDDFGTGYSSLSYLKRFPIDTLKIDQSFISELRDGTEDAAISTAIIALAHSLDLEVIAEGVETKEQLEILLALGCDAAQGFYFGRPAPAAEVYQLWPRDVPSQESPIHSI